jgi:hypothetical protein
MRRISSHAGERLRHRVARGTCQVGSDHATEDAACQHPRNGTLLVRGRHQLGGREAVELCVGVVVARQRRGGEQQHEAVRDGRPCAQGRRDDRHQQPSLKGAPTSPCALVTCHQRRSQRTAADIRGEGQRGHPTQRRQLQTDQAVDRHERHVVDEEQALAKGQQQQSMVHVAIRSLARRLHPRGGRQAERA